VRILQNFSAAMRRAEIGDLEVRQRGERAGRVPPQSELIAETIKLLGFIVRTPAGRRVTELVRVAGHNAREGFSLMPAKTDQEFEAVTA
jgi:hypothetical protein